MFSDNFACAMYLDPIVAQGATFLQNNKVFYYLYLSVMINIYRIEWSLKKKKIKITSMAKKFKWHFDRFSCRTLIRFWRGEWNRCVIIWRIRLMLFRKSSCCATRILERYNNLSLVWSSSFRHLGTDSLDQQVNYLTSTVWN